MHDKNLFPYNLAVAAIFKDEAPYLREWLDYHLLAGVEHFYLYNNDSTDNFREVLDPYVAANLVTLIDFPGKAMQIPAYANAINQFRFECRYMAFIDLDEFIFPKTNQSIAEVVDEILSRDENAAALAINQRIFGSNGQDFADYSCDVLERFTRRAPDNWEDLLKREEKFLRVGNIYVKLIVNPRKVKFMSGPHVAIHFGENYSVNELGEKITSYANDAMTADKIVSNHYCIKSREEYFGKVRRGYACEDTNPYNENFFRMHDRNEIFDDGILRYRATRAENFSIESDADRIARAEKTLFATLTQCSPVDAPPEFFFGKTEIFLTCRALAELFGTKIGSHSAEEYALVWLRQSFIQKNLFTYADLQLFLNELPALLARPFPLCRELNQIAREKIFPIIYADLKDAQEWNALCDFKYIERLLKLIK